MDPLLAISILPVVILLIYIYRKDKNEREPFGLLLRAFFRGVLVAGIIMLFALVMALLGIDDLFDFEDSAIMQSFFQAAIPEEGLKFLFLYGLIWKNAEFNEHFDGIVYAVFLSMGFACLENILYVYTHGFSTGVARAFLAVPGHFLFAVIMGYYLSKARFSLFHRGRLLAFAIIFPILAHGLYDTFCFMIEMYGESTGLSVVLTLALLVFDVVLWSIGLKKINSYCHSCGRKISKGQMNCPYCQHIVNNRNRT